MEGNWMFGKVDARVLFENGYCAHVVRTDDESECPAPNIRDNEDGYSDWFVTVEAPDGKKAHSIPTPHWVLDKYGPWKEPYWTEQAIRTTLNILSTVTLTSLVEVSMYMEEIKKLPPEE